MFTIARIEKQDTYEANGKRFIGSKIHGTDGNLYAINQFADQTPAKEGDVVTGDLGDWQQFGSWQDGPNKGAPMMWRKVKKARVTPANGATNGAAQANGHAAPSTAKRAIGFSEFCVLVGYMENSVAKTKRVNHPDATPDVIATISSTTMNTVLIRLLDKFDVQPPDLGTPGYTEGRQTDDGIPW